MHEHTNHFSPLSLASLARIEGFNLRRVSYHLCSRPFGFVGVFDRKAGPHIVRDGTCLTSSMGESEVILATACMNGGLFLLEQYHSQLRTIRSKIRDVCNRGGKVLLWAANQVCIDLLNGLELPHEVVVVDSNPAKKNYLKPVPVHTPGTMRDFIRSAELVVINTSLHADAIVRFVKEEVGRSLSPDEVCIVK